MFTDYNRRPTSYVPQEPVVVNSVRSRQSIGRGHINIAPVIPPHVHDLRRVGGGPLPPIALQRERVPLGRRGDRNVLDNRVSIDIRRNRGRTLQNNRILNNRDSNLIDNEASIRGTVGPDAFLRERNLNVNQEIKRQRNADALQRVAEERQQQRGGGIGDGQGGPPGISDPRGQIGSQGQTGFIDSTWPGGQRPRPGLNDRTGASWVTNDPRQIRNGVNQRQRISDPRRQQIQNGIRGEQWLNDRRQQIPNGVNREQWLNVNDRRRQQIRNEVSGGQWVNGPGQRVSNDIRGRGSPPRDLNPWTDGNGQPPIQDGFGPANQGRPRGPDPVNEFDALNALDERGRIFDVRTGRSGRTGRSNSGNQINAEWETGMQGGPGPGGFDQRGNVVEPSLTGRRTGARSRSPFISAVNQGVRNRVVASALNRKYLYKFISL